MCGLSWMSSLRSSDCRQVGGWLVRLVGRVVWCGDEVRCAGVWWVVFGGEIGRAAMSLFGQCLPTQNAAAAAAPGPAGVMPAKNDFVRAGRYDIARAVERWGGLYEVRALHCAVLPCVACPPLLIAACSRPASPRHACDASGSQRPLTQP